MTRRTKRQIVEEGYLARIEAQVAEIRAALEARQYIRDKDLPVYDLGNAVEALNDALDDIYDLER